VVAPATLPRADRGAGTAVRRRLDAELVRRGLAPSRERAQADIAAGRVLVSGTRADKASRQVDAAEPIVLEGPPPRFVSRAGEKLAPALGRFGVEVTGRRVLDAGASTGGFTDCVLQEGAASVVAVDVGYGQLHEKVRSDPRVEVHDRTNVRHVEPGDLGPPVGVVVADLSFISLRLVIAPLLAQCEPGADLVLLVKPQFEAGRREVSRGRGIIGDPEVWRSVLLDVIAAVAAAGATIMGLMVSPITGTDGNVEFVLHARAATAAAPSAPPADVPALVDAAIAAASGTAATAADGEA
jgi:23S rRNA (cytidine1920-2'-O)/16S rRNA (cytidine1409-2'-O)-methyltransferase